MKVKFSLKENPEVFFETEQRECFLGRSTECEVFIKDVHAHRRHAVVTLEQDHTFSVKSLGQNPVIVNGTPVHDPVTIKDGDTLTVGKTELLFSVERDEPVVEEKEEDKTLFLSPDLAGEKVGPRLVLTRENGESQAFRLDQRQVLIGRSAEARIVLHHAGVSGKHCLVEERDGGVFVTNLSKVNPIRVNDRFISEERLYGGDRLKIGPFTLTYVSDRPEDVRPPEEKIIARMGLKSRVALGVLILLVLAAGGYIGYFKGYRPWKYDKLLDSLAARVEKKEYHSSRKGIEELMAQELPQRQHEKARALLLKITLQIAGQMEEKGQLVEARKHLSGFIEAYGAGKPADAIPNYIDRVRMKMARQHASRGEHEDALKEYSAIAEQSRYFDEAQGSISRIWIEHQQQSYREKKIPELVMEAEKNFISMRYLVPVNDNAYAAYQAILSIDPGNSLAIQRINQMKAFYRETGERNFKSGEWEKALIYFRRYSLIDSTDQEIKERIVACKKELDRQGRLKKADSKEQLQKVPAGGERRRMPESPERADGKTEWVMKHLFSEGEKP
ncbi:MAG: FHA domain-containing protein [Desulfobacteraceae bacterium]|nr:MAG: FHA domain-containing protein [Desulfobacteraceae bacterium]